MSIKTVKKSHLFKPVHPRAWKKQRPLDVTFELTYRCNFRCPYCYIEGSKKRGRELTTGQVFTILDQMREMGVLRVTFTGGEALLRKDIFDILNYAKRSGFLTGLFSNGYFINKKTADELVRTNVDSVTISFNSLKADTFQKLTGVKDSLKRVRAAFGLLIRRGIHIEITTIGMSVNHDELVNIGRFARSLDITYHITTEVVPCRSGRTSSVDIYSLGADEIQEAQAAHREAFPETLPLDEKKKSPLRFRHDRIFNCEVGKSSFLITPYGKINFCGEIEYPGYDLLKYGVSRCWERIKMEVDRLNKAPYFVCRSCDLSRYCGGCPSMRFLESGTFNKCSKYLKKRAVEFKQREDAQNERKKGNKKDQ